MKKSIIILIGIIIGGWLMAQFPKDKIKLDCREFENNDIHICIKEKVVVRSAGCHSGICTMRYYFDEL